MPECQRELRTRGGMHGAGMRARTYAVVMILYSLSAGLDASVVPSTHPAVNASNGTQPICIMWRQTGGCSHSGPREPQHDRPCSDVIERIASGYCECSHGIIVARSNCGHAVLRCTDECNRAQAGKREAVHHPDASDKPGVPPLLVGVTAGDYTTVDATGTAPVTAHTDPSLGEAEFFMPDEAAMEAELDVAEAHHRLSHLLETVGVVRECPVSLDGAGDCHRPWLDWQVLPSRRTTHFSRLVAVRNAFVHAWKGYRAHAWGNDTVQPISKSPGKDQLAMGLSIVDSLDTLLIMGLPDEYAEARDWVVNSLSFVDQEDINLFETTIRVTGGLLSAYELSGDQAILERAVEIGSKMMFAFDSPSGIPFGTLGLRTKKAFNPGHRGASSAAEVGTLALELAVLSKHTGSSDFLQRADTITRKLRELAPSDGLYPMYINPKTGQFMESTITLGARGDSLYEYLLKQWLIWGASDRKSRQWIRDMYDTSVDGILRVLLQKSTPSGLLYVAEQPRRHHGSKLRHKMDHLVCFLPGLIALGVDSAPPPVSEERSHALLAGAAGIMQTCYQMYVRHPTGLAPEIVQFTNGGDLQADKRAKHSLLRPETVESLFVMYRVTGNPMYQEWGWNIFKCMVKHGRIAGGGFSGVKDVTTVASPHNDHMESFFLSETLKYLYLLLSDSDLLSLDSYVFNTEGHPFRRFTDQSSN